MIKTAKPIPFRKIAFGKVDIRRTDHPDGTITLTSSVPLAAHPHRVTDRLAAWAGSKPNQVFLAQRNSAGQWEYLTYLETLRAVEKIAQSLLDRNLTPETPIAILSENSIEHALLGLAALHIGLPHTAISTAYSLRSRDFRKLGYCMEQLTPGLIFVQELAPYLPALKAVAGTAEIVTAGRAVISAKSNLPATPFSALRKTAPTAAVGAAFSAINPDSVAKILFTSGSTGEPKGVINTHGNLTANWQQITQTYPFLAEGFTTVDWLPWNHTYGGNHNLGLVLFNGGTLYIDNGNPTPAGIPTTLENLREIAPTVYFNVPRGFEVLIPFLKKDKDLRENFFSRLDMLFNAGASLSQPAWDALDALAAETTGKKIVMGIGLGCTESSPGALFKQQEAGFAGLVGIPAPGLELKLVPRDGKLEARFKGPNISPGYWRHPNRTAEAYDPEGFFKTGDALRFADPHNPRAGLVYDGRLAEDFKLDSGTWVNAGLLRSRLIAASGGLVQDAVLTGLDRPFIGAIVFPNVDFLKRLTGKSNYAAMVADERARLALKGTLEQLAAQNDHNAACIRRAVFADFKPSMDGGEITDKGTLNQSALRDNHPSLVEAIYANDHKAFVVEC
ncbi:MAG: feruloyl-CoA synthase [Saprospiraceae bacterium]